jgi:hypothetical protein
MAVVQPKVYQWKNPYHLFQTFHDEKGYPQSKTVEELVKTLKELFPGKSKHIDKGRFSTILQQDYLDFGDEEWVAKHDPHFATMSKIIADQRKIEFDILDIDDRIALEEATGYSYPDNSKRQAGERWPRAVRGVWQLAHASALAEDIEGRREPHHIRAAILLVHGFLEDRHISNNKPCIKAVIIGRTGIWKARVWTATKKLFVSAEDYATDEDQFFIFQVPDFANDPLVAKRFNSMRGIMMGTVLDEEYGDPYPVVTAMCGAWRASAATAFFEKHDQCIDANFIGQLREQLPCGYFDSGAVAKTFQIGKDELEGFLGRKEGAKSHLVIK